MAASSPVAPPRFGLAGRTRKDGKGRESGAALLLLFFSFPSTLAHASHSCPAFSRRASRTGEETGGGRGYGGYGFKSCWSLRFFGGAFCATAFKLLHNCKDHFHLYCLSSVHIYHLYHMLIVWIIMLYSALKQVFFPMEELAFNIWIVFVPIFQMNYQTACRHHLLHLREVARS